LKVQDLEFCGADDLLTKVSNQLHLTVTDVLRDIRPETGSIICCPLKAVVIERHPPRTERLSQRAKKL